MGGGKRFSPFDKGGFDRWGKRFSPFDKGGIRGGRAMLAPTIFVSFTHYFYAKLYKYVCILCIFLNIYTNFAKVVANAGFGYYNVYQ